MRVLAPQDSNSIGAAEMILQAAGACHANPVDSLPDVRFRTSTYFKENLVNQLDRWESKHHHYPPLKYLELNWRRANIIVAILDDERSLRIKQDENFINPENPVFLSAHAWVGKCKGTHDLQLVVYLKPKWQDHKEEVLENLAVCLSHEWHHLRQRAHPTGDNLNDINYRKQTWEMEADAFAIKEQIARTGNDLKTAATKVLDIVTQDTRIADTLLQDDNYLNTIQKLTLEVPDYTHQAALLRLKEEHLEMLHNGASAEKLLHQTDGHGNTFLHLIAKAGMIDQVIGGVNLDQLLTKNQAGDTVLHLTAESGCLGKLTVQFTAKQLTEIKSHKETALHSAVRGACLDQVAGGVIVQDLFLARDVTGMTALQLAAGDPKILVQLKLLTPKDVNNIQTWYQAKGSDVTWQDLHQPAPFLPKPTTSQANEVPF